MTDAELAEIENRCEAATKGPWIPKHLKTFSLQGDGEHEVRSRETRVTVARITFEMEENRNTEQADRDVEFIAASRQDLPALLAHVRELRGALRELIDIFSDVRVEGEIDSLTLQPARTLLGERHG